MEYLFAGPDFVIDILVFGALDKPTWKAIENSTNFEWVNVSEEEFEMEQL
jgi:hypothetical protein